MSVPPETELHQNYVFSNGMWELKKGVSIDWATEFVKIEARGKELYSVSTTRKINHRGDTLNAPTITTVVSSPAEDVIGMEATHLKGIKPESPRFQINKSESDVKISLGQNGAPGAMTAGSMAAEYCDTKSFGIDFKEKTTSKLLTKLGFRSLGYVRDQRVGNYETHRPYMTAQLHLSVGEKIYGLGERFGPFIKNGQSVEMWNKDGGTSSEQTYKNIPFYMSSRGYGVFVDHASNVNFEIQSERTTRVNIVVPGEKIRFFIIHGPSPKEILQKYTKLTGIPALPPPWTFGLWLSTCFTTSYDFDTVSGFIQGMKDREIPLSTFHFDAYWMKQFQWCDFEFDSDYFPDPKHTLTTLKSKFGVRICVWLNSYVSQESKLFEEGDRNKYFVQNTNGESWQTDVWQAGMAIVDFTNPEACKWFQSKLKQLLDIGVDCFKSDFGERIPARDVVYHDGSDPVVMHNYYAYLYNKCVFELLEKERGQHEACLFARAATTGGQQFPVHWGGDCESTFEAMAETVRGGLSLSSSGFGFWSHDIGGFEGDPDPAIYKRWVAFGLLSSHSRLHGSGSYRVPWNFDEEACDVLKKFTNLKCSLMPYIYSQAVYTHRCGVPLLRTTFLEFPEQEQSWHADTQFMFGPNLLVAPVFDESTEGKVTYYVPGGGDWYGFLDGEIRSGGQYVTETHGFMSIPLLVRAGSVVVTGDTIDTPEYDYSSGITVNLFEIGEGDEVAADIPDCKNLGLFAGAVTAKRVVRNGAPSALVVSGRGVSSWRIRLLGVKSVQGVDGGREVEADRFGNVTVEATGPTVTVEL